MFAGFCAGITEALVIVTPFEVVKIRLQQQRGMVQSQMKYHVSLSTPFPPFCSHAQVLLVIIRQ